MQSVGVLTCEGRRGDAVVETEAARSMKRGHASYRHSRGRAVDAEWLPTYSHLFTQLPSISGSVRLKMGIVYCNNTEFNCSSAQYK